MNSEVPLGSNCALLFALLCLMAGLAGCLAEPEKEASGAEVAETPSGTLPGEDGPTNRSDSRDHRTGDQWTGKDRQNQLKWTFNTTFDLGNRTDQVFQVASNLTQMPTAGDQRGIASTSLRQGAAVFLLDWREAYDTSWNLRLSLTGAFLRDGQLVESPSDSWFFSRVIYPGPERLYYNDNYTRYNGGAAVAVNESSWTVKEIGSGSGTQAPGDQPPDGRYVSVIVGWRMPAEATHLALATCIDACSPDRFYTPEQAFNSLETRTSQPVAMDPLQVSDEAHLAYWGWHHWNQSYQSRFPPTVLNMATSIEGTESLEDSIYIDRLVEAHATLQPMQGWGETYISWVENYAMPREWDISITAHDRVYETKSNGPTYDSFYGLHFGGFDNNASWQSMNYWHRVQAMLHGPYVLEDAGSPAVLMQITQTGLDLEEALNVRVPTVYRHETGPN